MEIFIVSSSTHSKYFLDDSNGTRIVRRHVTLCGPENDVRQVCKGFSTASGSWITSESRELSIILVMSGYPALSKHDQLRSGQIRKGISF